jgi:hypothetical protein
MKEGTCSGTPSHSPTTADVPGRLGEAVLGDGPVYVGFRAIPRLLDALPPERRGLSRSIWRTGETVWISEPTYRGPVLVRGRRIDGPGRIGFGDAVNPRPELYLGPESWADRGGDAKRWRRAVRRGWRLAYENARIQTSGCYAFQIDGDSFRDVIVFAAQVQQ